MRKPWLHRRGGPCALPAASSCIHEKMFGVFVQAANSPNFLYVYTVVPPGGAEPRFRLSRCVSGAGRRGRRPLRREPRSPRDPGHFPRFSVFREGQAPPLRGMPSPGCLSKNGRLVAAPTRWLALCCAAGADIIRPLLPPSLREVSAVDLRFGSYAAAQPRRSRQSPPARCSTVPGARATDLPRGRRRRSAV